MEVRCTLRLCSWLCAASLAATPSLALASPMSVDVNAFFKPSGNAITPDRAQEARVAVQTQARGMAAASPGQAADFLVGEATRLRDPVLFLDAADAFKSAAENDRSIEVAEQAKVQVLVAQDMLFFLQTDSSSEEWEPLEASDVGGSLTRAAQILEDCDALIAEIEAELAAPVEEEEPEKERSMKPGTGLIIGGSVAAVIGVGAAGLGVAGLFKGAAAQRDVEDPEVYMEDHLDAEQRGESGNLMAYVGFSVAAVGIGVGAALIVLGLKKRKKAGGGAEEPDVAVAPSFDGRSGAGLAISGRF